LQAGVVTGEGEGRGSVKILQACEVLIKSFCDIWLEIRGEFVKCIGGYRVSENRKCLGKSFYVYGFQCAQRIGVDRGGFFCRFCIGGRGSELFEGNGMAGFFDSTDLAVKPYFEEITYHHHKSHGDYDKDDQSQGYPAP